MIERLEERRLLTGDYGLVALGDSPATPEAGVPTYVMVHGWNGSPDTSWGFGTIGATLQDRIERIVPDAQVYAFDWSDAAGTGLDFLLAESRIPAAGAGLAALLSSVSTNLHLIGHSFGAYVAYETAALLGGIASITALDGGTDVPFGYDATGLVNYSAVADASWSLYGSSLGNSSIASTADHAVTVRWADGDTDDNLRHNHVVQLFNGLLQGDYAHVPSLDLGHLVGEAVSGITAGSFGAAGDLGGSLDAVMLATLDQVVPLGVETVRDGDRWLDLVQVNPFNSNGTGRVGLIADVDPSAGSLDMERDGSTAQVTWTDPITAKIAIYGSDVGDYIDARQSNAALLINGMDGDDILVGGEFDDEIYGGNNRDSLHGLGGNDFLAGQSHADKAFGGFGDDVISGKTGNDYLRGEPGDDTIYGDSGADYIRGHTGNDYIVGGSSNDKLYGDEDDDTLIGNGGRDYLRGWTGFDMADDDADDAVVSDIEELT